MFWHAMHSLIQCKIDVVLVGTKKFVCSSVNLYNIFHVTLDISCTSQSVTLRNKYIFSFEDVIYTLNFWNFWIIPYSLSLSLSLSLIYIYIYIHMIKIKIRIKT